MKAQKFVFAALFISTVLFVITFFAPLKLAATGSLNPQRILEQSLLWIESLGVIGALVFIGIYIIATVAFFPGSILTLGAGVLFGVTVGSLYVFVGATLGALAAFLIGRYFARGWLTRKIAGNTKFTAIDNAVSEKGFKIVLLTRLSPIFPFNFLNYAFGLTSVSLRDYFLASIGMIPGIILYVYIGSLAGDIALIGTNNAPTNSTLVWIPRVVGFVITILTTVYVTRVARNALNKTLLS